MKTEDRLKNLEESVDKLRLQMQHLIHLKGEKGTFISPESLKDHPLCHKEKKE